MVFMRSSRNLIVASRNEILYKTTEFVPKEF